MGFMPNIVKVKIRDITFIVVSFILTKIILCPIKILAWRKINIDAIKILSSRRNIISPIEILT